MTATQTSQSARNGFRQRRRKHIVNPSFQWKYVASIVVGVFAVSSIVTVATLGILHQAVRATMLHPPAATYGEVALTVVLCSLGFAIAPAVAFGLYSVFYSHRMCGPLLILEQNLREIINGGMPKQRPLRKKDQFKTLHDLFWCALETLEERKRRDLVGLHEIQKLVQSYMEQDGESRERTLEAIAAQMESLCEEVKSSLKTPLHHQSEETCSEAGTEQRRCERGQ